MRQQTKIGPIITRIIFIILVVVSASYLIIIANGYKINYKKLSLIKTGMIYVRSDPRDTQVSINNGLKSAKTPYRLSDVYPGRYDVKVSKVGYNDWNKTFVVSEGMVSSDDNVILFLVKPENLVVQQSEKDNFEKFVAEWPAVGLKINNDNEIWFNDILVTRFYQKVLAVNWHSDLKHIMYQIDSEIRMMDADGSNNIILAKLNSVEPAQFVPFDNGDSLLYKDNGEVKKIKIK